jgi:hypothetical protein
VGFLLSPGGSPIYPYIWPGNRLTFDMNPDCSPSNLILDLTIQSLIDWIYIYIYLLYVYIWWMIIWDHCLYNSFLLSLYTPDISYMVFHYTYMRWLILLIEFQFFLGIIWGTWMVISIGCSLQSANQHCWLFGKTSHNL